VGAKVSQMLVSVNSAKKKHAFRKGVSFLRILRKKRTFPKGSICRFSQEFTKCSRKTQQTRTNSLNAHEQRTNSIFFYEKHTIFVFVHEKRTFSEKGCHFCEFCENDERFPWVEFVDFLKIGGWGAKGGLRGDSFN